MTAINATPDTITGAPAIQDVWSVGDYDRLASYGSAPEAARLVRFAGVQPGDRVLDVGTGSGLVAIIAAQQGARATGVDPTPELLAKAKENAALAGCRDIEWHEGAAEVLPFSRRQLRRRPQSIRAHVQSAARGGRSRNAAGAEAWRPNRVRRMDSGWTGAAAHGAHFPLLAAHAWRRAAVAIRVGPRRRRSEVPGRACPRSRFRTRRPSTAGTQHCACPPTVRGNLLDRPCSSSARSRMTPRVWHNGDTSTTPRPQNSLPTVDSGSTTC